MNADKLRELAARLDEHADLHQELATHDQEQALWGLDLRSAADYLRACADAMEKGPVAWMHDDPARKDVIHEEVRDLLAQVDAHYHRPLDRTARYTIPLYPVALPPALRLPEPMTDDALNKASSRLRDDLLDHIYEHTTLSEGILPMLLALCRAIEAEVIRRVKEMNE